MSDECGAGPNRRCLSEGGLVYYQSIDAQTFMRRTAAISSSFAAHVTI